MTVDDFSDIKRPGTMFKWGSETFLSDGVTFDELNVIRINNYGSRDHLPVDQLKDAIESGAVQLVQTHTEDEVAVNEDVLVDAMAFLADDPALDCVDPDTGGVGESILAIEEALPADAYHFRFRDE